MTNVCPICGADQAESLACHACTLRLEQVLSEVPALVRELDTALSKQARIGNPNGGGGGLARERSPLNFGAMTAADTLGNVLGTWARDVVSRDVSWSGSPALFGAHILLQYVDAIRRHPAVAELVDEITDAVEQARRVIDRPADRQYLGQCLVAVPDEYGQDVECTAELWAKPDAESATCKTCGIQHDVSERRAWLLLKAADMLTTAKEASRYLGDVGGIKVTEASIRGLIHRQRLAYRAGTTFRLGDLLEVLADMRAKEAA